MALNPVEQRMVELRQYWEAFRADTSKRLLVWKVSDAATRMLQCFFEAQKHESEYATGDVFIVFDAPFVNSIQYSRVLKEALVGHYEASQDVLKAQGLPTDWELDAQNSPDSTSGFIRGLLSFGSKYYKNMGHLVAVLMPQTVADPDAWCGWLSRALNADMPERLRLAVVDFNEAPRLDKLTSNATALTYVDSPKIDTLATAQETFAQEAVVGPAGVFRNYLIGLVTLVEKGSADQVKAKAVDAIAFARKQKWDDQEVAVSMLVAGAMLKENRFKESIEMYQHARKSSLQAVAAGHPIGQQLALQTWFGEAGVHLAAGDVPKAIKSYDQAADLAQKIPNLLLAVEALRMSAFCHARTQHNALAIERGHDALKVGERLKPEARNMTTLPLVAIETLRAIEPQRVEAMEKIKHQLDKNIEGLDQAVESKAVELEMSSESKKFRNIETVLARETLRAEKDAARELDAVAANGSSSFSETFAYARKLLGSAWPLSTSIALPTAPKADELTEAAGGAAA
jgi:tetratricopeptide (TPR) repeat protein